MKRRRIKGATSTLLKKIELKYRGLSLYAETERTGKREVGGVDLRYLSCKLRLTSALCEKADVCNRPDITPQEAVITRVCMTQRPVKT